MSYSVFVDDPFPVMQEKCHLCRMFAPFWRLSRWVAQPNDCCVFLKITTWNVQENFPFVTAEIYIYIAQNFHFLCAVLRFWLVVQPKLTSLGLLQVIRTEESQNSSLILVISLLTLGAGGSKKTSRRKLEFPSLPVRFC